MKREKVFVSEKIVKMVGPRIKARSWADARRKAHDLGVKIVGVLPD